MRTAKYFLMAVMATGLAVGLGVFGAADDAKPKYDIEEIMEKAHGGKAKSLFNQVKTGKASEEQQKQLLDLYKELAKNKPPKGDLKDWQKRTKAMVKAAEDVVNGKQGATQALGKAVQCGACHKAHKGD